MGNPIGLDIHKTHVHVYVHVFISKHQWWMINKRKRIEKKKKEKKSSSWENTINNELVWLLSGKRILVGDINKPQHNKYKTKEVH